MQKVCDEQNIKIKKKKKSVLLNFPLSDSRIAQHTTLDDVVF